MMTLLAIGTDPALLDPKSYTWRRQERYYKDWEADIILLGTGTSEEVHHLGIRVRRSGGTNKVQSLFRAFVLARAWSREKNYSVVSVQDPWWSGLVGLIASIRRATPVFLQDHSGYFGRASSTWTEKLFRPVSFWLARRAKRIRIVSKRSLQGLVSQGVSAQKIDHIPVYSPLPTEVARTYRAQAKVLFSVGRLEPEKGYETCLRAWAALPQLDGMFVIAGDGQERTRYEQLCRELGIEKRVQFLGHQTDLSAYWEQADVYIQPSFFEGWCRALLEAAVQGLPIISSDVGFVGDVLRSEESVLVAPAGDVLAMSQAIERLWYDATLRERLGYAAEMAAKQRAWSEDQVVAAVRQSLQKTAS